MANKENHINQDIKENSQQLEEFMINDVTYLTIIPPKYKKRKTYSKKDLHLVYSFIPGIIKGIRVKEKEEVHKGDILCDLEAMKMNNKVLAPIDGKIKKINIKEGDKVAKDQVLFEISTIKKSRIKL
ncbi:MAG TPA: acetyl-CoA carboxylase biotin carboxyl carrier protein subunit [Bacteroidales bacterium]|jgi:biotin carboxyl carrier protein|nr:acetyl-CoA carboxylase biotin carboxyl carrier protein subunit [Bacteroidales bacterium]